MKYLRCFKRLSKGLEMDEFGKAFVLQTGFMERRRRRETGKIQRQMILSSLSDHFLRDTMETLHEVAPGGTFLSPALSCSWKSGAGKLSLDLPCLPPAGFDLFLKNWFIHNSARKS